ncbi:glycosyl transferase [Neptunitalea chrysea]|uniref:Glycosyl transferase n=1 Tax=Neptunitalea chrysea TaxID=1647581 RepID=A0A9W6EVW1_9FLAO|nr:glycosyltransferase [Neptunitalea chrysea]GLB52058.1 glycosyl transferase [Neptunitalea chrysea]
MRSVQLIDSLEPGGAERMAVNIANGFANKGAFSGLVTTRKEGALLDTVSNTVDYLFLERVKVLDLKSILLFRTYIKRNKVEVVHAHSSSFFIAVLTKLTFCRFKIVWHDHYGKSDFLSERSSRVFTLCKSLINSVVVVNKKLADWNRDVVGFKKIEMIPNFVTAVDTDAVTRLKGTVSKRIICLANYRPQKDHLNLIKAFSLVLKQYTDWTLHLVGKDFNDAYSLQINALIEELNLRKSIFLYGSVQDTGHVLSQATIGVLASESEGLPLALLEYGLMSLPVVVTNVGECGNVITHEKNGLLVPSGNADALAKALSFLIQNEDVRLQYGTVFSQHVMKNHGIVGYLERLEKVYEQA